jgi:hypothetical protein
VIHLGYKRSVFPEGGIDTLQELFDLPPSQLANAERFQILKIKDNKTMLEITEFNNLTITLQNYIIDVEKWNKFCDICINLETFFRDNVQGYIDTKQTEFNTVVNAKTSEFNTSVSTKTSEFNNTVSTKTTEFNVMLQQFTNKGQFNSLTTYKMWNTVVYNNQTFMSLQENNLNHTPADGSSNAYWQIMALRGSTGIGIGLVMSGLYNNATAYIINQAVSYEGSIFYCTQNTTGNMPTNNTYWSLFQANMSPTISENQPSSPILGAVWIETF